MEVQNILLSTVCLLLFIQPSLQIRFCGDNDMKTFQGHCYFFSYPTTNYENAKELCVNMNALITSIHSLEEGIFIHDGMDPTTYYDYWIGLEKQPDASYKWADGTPLDYENWYPGEPGGAYYDCVEARIYDKKWLDSSCGSYSEYVCKAKVEGGWMEYNNNEYHMSSLPEEISMSWQEAQGWCMTNGGDLASILTAEEGRQLVTWADLNAYEGPLWIGLNKLADKRDAWTWSDGSPYSSSWRNWKESFPKDDDYKHLCGYLSSDDSSGFWMNGHCGLGKGFICKRPVTANPTPKTTQPTPVIGGYCPAGYTGVGNKCFKVVLAGDNGERGLLHAEAVAKCQKEPGVLPSLASISSELEQAYVSAQLQERRFGVWIGLTRPYFGEDWRWADSSALTYENWAPNKPDRTHHCVELWMIEGAVGKWNNVNCLDIRGYVCQTYKDATNIIPTSAPPPGNFTCPSGFTKYWYGCYKYQTAMTYDDAKVVCNGLNINAKLVGIHDEAENAAIQTEAINKESDLWIGLSDRNPQTEGEYTWEDGWVVFYVNWGVGQPAKDSGGGCVAMSPDGKWSDFNCQLSKPSVCKYTSADARTTPATVEGECPGSENWFEYHEHCYLFEPYEYDSWSSAKQECQKKGVQSTLASIHSFQENQMIYDRLKAMGASSRSVWIGLYRSTADRTQLKWTDDSALQYEAWAPNEPNGGIDDDEDCVEMYNEHWPGLWNDHDCGDYKGFVCKAPKTIPGTEPTQNPKCEEGWVHSSLYKSCYLFKPDNERPRSVAQDYCAQFDAQLPSVHGAFEDVFIEVEMRAHSKLPPTGYTYYWLGLKVTEDDNTDEYIYTWEDGMEHTYENWDYYQPSNPDYYTCVRVDKTDGKWSMATCTYSYGVVCKKAHIDVTPPDKDSGDGLSGGEVAGIVIGVLFGMILISLIAIGLLVHKQIISNPIDKIPSLSVFGRSSASPSATSDVSVSYEKQA